jgi:hypothetical protein
LTDPRCSKNHVALQGWQKTDCWTALVQRSCAPGQDVAHCIMAGVVQRPCQAKELSLVRDHASAPVLSPITSRAAWRGDQLSQGQDWVYELSAAQVAELEALGTLHG